MQLFVQLLVGREQAPRSSGKELAKIVAGTASPSALLNLDFRVAAFAGVHALACIFSLKAVLQRRYPTLILSRDTALVTSPLRPGDVHGKLCPIN